MWGWEWNSDVGEESKEEFEDPGDKCVPIGYDDTDAEDMDFREEDEDIRGMIVGSNGCCGLEDE